MNSLRLILIALCLFLVGCQTAGDHVASLQNTKDDRLTVGVVQKEIKVGMSQSKVLEVLGSPNIVTKDSDGTETWGYDKITTETVTSKDTGGVNVLILGYGAESGATSVSQRTLTVIIKFSDGLVREFSYHASRF